MTVCNHTMLENDTGDKHSADEVLTSSLLEALYTTSKIRVFRVVACMEMA